MKLRQKLAVVLASAMVVTAVPVVTMAASTNSLSKETLKVKKDAEFKDIATANAVKVKFTDYTEGKDEVFYLDLDNAEWKDDVLKAASEASDKFTRNGEDDYTYQYSDKVTIGYQRQNDNTMKITVSGLTGTDPYVLLPIVAKAKDGDAKVSVVNQGGTTVSNSTFVFATTAEKKVSVTAKDDKSFYTEGVLSEITIEEAYQGSLKDGAEFTIEIDDTDFYFTGAFTAEFKYGFSGKAGKVTAEVQSDDGVLKVKIDPITGDSRGTIVLKDIKVKSTNRKPETGDFLVDIKGDDLVSEKTNLKVAKVSDYSVYVKAKDDKAKDVKAGRKEEVEIEIGENVDDSMRTGNNFDITLENGHWDYKQFVKDAYDAGKLEGKVDGKSYNKDADYSDEDLMKWATKINEYWLADKIMDNTGDWKTTKSTPAASDKTEYCAVEFDQDDDGQAIPETLVFTIGNEDDGDLVQNNGDCDKIKLKTKICVPVGMKDKEKVTIKIAGRGVENEASATVINIINPFDVTFEQAVLKTGLQGQVSGSVTLKETDKDCLQKGKVFFKITKDNEDFDIYLTDATVETSAGLKGTKATVNKGKTTTGASIDLKLNRVSKEAATVTFKDLKFTTSRTVPEGTYDLEIYGDAIDSDYGWTDDDATVDNHRIVVKDFIKISTTNTQDITANGLAKGVASFVIGESKYTLNGQEVTMDAPSYIQDPGYTMVPARYVAQAFGVSEKDILFNKGTVTIFAGERTINLKTGSNVATVNGNQIAMAAKVVNKDGRTYIPAGQLASLLGISSSWDSASKTATFENK